MTEDQKYNLAEDSEFDSVEVDNKTLTKYGRGVKLTQDQHDRVMQIDGVELVSDDEAEDEQDDVQETTTNVGEE